MVLSANKEVDPALARSLARSAVCNLQMNCFSLGQPMWEHAGLICFYPPCSPLRCPDQASPLYNPTGRPVCTMRWHLYRPRQKLPFYHLARPSSQRTVRLCMSVVSAIPRWPRQCTCFCRRGACKHYLSAHTTHGNKRRHTISSLLRTDHEYPQNASWHSIPSHSALADSGQF